MNNPPSVDGWNEWSRHVLKELERLDKCRELMEEKLAQSREVLEEKSDNLNTKVDNQNIKITKLETEMRIKSGLLGGIVSLIVTVAILIIKALLTGGAG